MSYNEKAQRYLDELKSGQLSEESKDWQENDLYQGTEDWWYALADGGYLSPRDIYTEEEAQKIDAAVALIEEFFSDYGQFVSDEDEVDEDGYYL